MPCKNPCRRYIHLAFTHSVGPSSIVVWKSELGPAPPFPPMRVLEAYWSRALSLVWEVALMSPRKLREPSFYSFLWELWAQGIEGEGPTTTLYPCPKSMAASLHGAPKYIYIYIKGPSNRTSLACTPIAFFPKAASAIKTATNYRSRFRGPTRMNSRHITHLSSSIFEIPNESLSSLYLVAAKIGPRIRY